MIKTIFFLALAVSFVAGSIATGTIAFADDSDGTVFYTLFDQTNQFNVKSVDFSYDSGTNSLTLMNIVNIAHTVDADGIVVNPQDTSKLIVGTGFSQSLEVVTIVGGAIVSQASPVDAFHLELIDANTIATTAIPGEMATHPIAGDGSIGAGTMITISGDDDVITQLIAMPGGGFFYTSSNFLGTGSYGELTFGGGNTATTSRIHSDLPAAHGGEYDPFSDTVIIVGSNHITQIDVNDDSILCDRVSGVDFTEPAGFDHFDQAIVDGAGHLIIADNGGNLFFVDYPSGDLCDGTTQVTSSFLDNTLDDIAPLIPPPPMQEDFFVGGGKVIVPLSAGIDLIPKKPSDETFILTHGFELHCDATQGPNNLEVNWGGKKDAHRFHLEELERTDCNDDGSMNEPPPSDKNDKGPGPTTDVYYGTGFGRFNGECGAFAEWVFDDNGEPGKADHIVAMEITDVSGNIVLSINPGELSTRDTSSAGTWKNPGDHSAVPWLDLKTGNHQWVPHPTSHKNPPTHTTPCPEVTP